MDIVCKVNRTYAVRGLIVSELQPGGWENNYNMGSGIWVDDLRSVICDLGSEIWDLGSEIWDLGSGI